MSARGGGVKQCIYYVYVVLLRAGPRFTGYSAIKWRLSTCSWFDKFYPFSSSSIFSVDCI